MIYIGILTVTTNVYGSRRTLRFGIFLDKKRKGIEDKKKETYRKKFEEKMQEVGLPASACKLSFRFETTLLADIDFAFFEDKATVNPINIKAHRERKAAQKAAALVRESEAIVQAREFSGEVYVCFNNVPILPADGLTWDVPTTLAVAREAWLK